MDRSEPDDDWDELLETDRGRDGSVALSRRGWEPEFEGYFWTRGRNGCRSGEGTTGAARFRLKPPYEGGPSNLFLCMQSITHAESSTRIGCRQRRVL